jgi:hypothetical protein
MKSDAMTWLSGVNKLVPSESYGNRVDGTAKGKGYMGPLAMQDGTDKIATELTVGVEMDGKEVNIPLLVPSLTGKEVQYLLKGNKPTHEIVSKAAIHARKRMSQGLSPYVD